MRRARTTLALLIFTACSKPGAKDAGAAPERGPLRSSEDAIRAAGRTLKVELKDARTELAPVPDLLQRIPFLKEPVAADKVWRVQGDAKSVVPDNSQIQSFELYLRPEDGAFLLMRSIQAEGSAKITPEIPSRAELERRMGATASRYAGVPADPPKITVSELLQKAREQGFAPLHLAKEIRIKRLIQSREAVNQGTQAVWVINVRGIPPRPGKGPAATLPEDERNHLRLVYDESGKLLFADNLLE